MHNATTAPDTDFAYDINLFIIFLSFGFSLFFIPFVIPPEGGIQFCAYRAKLVLFGFITQVGFANWIPAFAGMTISAGPDKRGTFWRGWFHPFFTRANRGNASNTAILRKSHLLSFFYHTVFFAPQTAPQTARQKTKKYACAPRRNFSIIEMNPTDDWVQGCDNPWYVRYEFRGISYREIAKTESR